MVSWTLAPSLVDLRDEANARWPGRDKTSDGSIGDPAHTSRASDHNPDAAGIVRAIDVDKDGANGEDVAGTIAQHILTTRDPRVKYVIWRGRMFSSYVSSTGTPAWTWRPYSGPNGHFSHVHISVLPGPVGSASGPWGLHQPRLGAPVRDFPGAKPDDTRTDTAPTLEGLDMAALDIIGTTDGAIYVAGPGIFRHVNGQQWNLLKRHGYEEPPSRINAAERDILRSIYLGAAGVVLAGVDASAAELRTLLKQVPAETIATLRAALA